MALLGDLRWRMLRAILWVNVGLSSLVAWRNLASGEGVVLAPLVVGAICMLAWALGPLWRRHDRWGLRLIMLLDMALVQVAQLHEKASLPVSPLSFLVILVICATLIDGLLSGLIYTLLAELLLIANWLRPEALMNWESFSSETVILTANAACCAILWTLYQRSTQALGQFNLRQDQVMQSQEAMSQALFEGVLPRLRALELESRAPELRQGLNEIQGALAAARQETLRHELPDSMPWQPGGTLAPFLIAVFVAALAVAARDLGLGQGQGWQGLLVAFIAAILWLATRRRSEHEPVYAVLAVSLITGVVLASILAYDPRPGLSLPFVPPMAFMATVLSGWTLGLSLSSLCLLVIFGHYRSVLPALEPHEWRTLSNLILLCLGMLGVCAVIEVMRRRALGRLQQQASELKLALSLRRRILATLFHDLANPLASALGALANEQPGELSLALARRLVARMRSLCDVARYFQLGEGMLEPGRLERVDMEGIYQDLLEVFEPRLREKGLTLVRQGEWGGQARAVPEALRESVLGNLLSNAIKFSPAGAQITLSAEREGSRWHLSLRDPGPGLDSQTLQRARRGDKPASRPGSQGEPGSGYGLNLAMDFAKRMGGSLEIEQPKGGGTVAHLHLESA